MTTRERFAPALLRRPGRAVRVTLLGAAVLLLAAAAVGLAAHWWSAGRSLALGVVAATPYLPLAAPVALVPALLARSRVAIAAAVVLTVAGGAIQAPLFVAQDTPANGHALRVMSANLRIGNAKATDVVATVKRHDVDVLMLQELTGTEETALTAAGLDGELPYHLSEPRQYAEGTGLWSRYPLIDQRSPDGFTFAFVTARLAVPGVADAPTVVALHMAGPVPDSSLWHRDIDRLPAVLKALPSSGPVIVGGDFNATPDTVQFRKVLDAGYADSADQAGAGVTATYPSDRSFPPLIAIDHVLTRGAVARSVDTLHIIGTDHRALLSTVVVPKGAE